MHLDGKLRAHAPSAIVPALRGGAMSIGAIVPALRGGAITAVLIVLAGCGRSRLAIGDEPAFDLAGAGAPPSAAGAQPGTGAVGSVDPGAPMVPSTAGVPGPPTAGPDSGGGGIAGRADSGGSAGRGGAFAPPGRGAGAAGPPPMQPPPPDMPGGDDGDNVLNPRRCATDHPFVLSIDPGGDSGQVQGWLESSPTVLFDRNDLPRFGAFSGPEEAGGDLALWWSIASVDEVNDVSTLWFYAANADTEVAHVGVTRPAAIGDARSLTYVEWSIGPVSVGEVAVFHHIPTDRFLAVIVVDLYGTEFGERRSDCTAVDARWVFAPSGSADFSTRR